jgi:hypothetical protein
MQTKALWTISVLALTASLALPARAVVPDLIPVQGVLADSAGEPLDGSYDMVFGIYPDETSGTVLWTETLTGGDAVIVDEGLFTVYLGDVSPLDFVLLLDATELWLQVQVGADPPMNRIRMASVLYAEEAEYCAQLGDLMPEDVQPLLDFDCGDGQFLRGWDIGSGAPVCEAGMGGGIGSINGDASAAQVFTTGTTGNDFALVDSGATHTFNLPNASASARGVVSTGGQTFAGAKTFSTAPTFSAATSFVVGGNGLVTDLNADLLDGLHATYFRDASNINAGVLAETYLPQNVIDSSEIEDGTLTATDLSVDVVASVDGVTNDGSGIDLVAGANMTITPNDSANMITLAATIGNNEASNTATITTSSGVWTNLSTDLAFTPGAGTYLVMFSSSVSSGSANTIDIGLAIDATVQPNSVRRSDTSANNEVVPIGTQAILTLTDPNSVRVQWQTGGGTASMYQRTLTVIRLQ